jgi:hypothetical protein
MPKATSLVSRIAHGPSLVQGNEYEVIGIDDEYYRVIDDKGDPILYPKNYFLESDLVPPDGWVVDKYEDGQYAASPPELAAPRFFEDYHDGRSRAVEVFKEFCAKIKGVSGSDSP